MDFYSHIFLEARVKILISTVSQLLNLAGQAGVKGPVGFQAEEIDGAGL